MQNVRAHKQLPGAEVDVLVLSPGPTRTEMVELEGTDMSKMPISFMEASEVAAAGLRSLGRKSAVVPGTLNQVMNFMATRIMPRYTALTMFGNMMAKTMDPAIL